MFRVLKMNMYVYYIYEMIYDGTIIIMMHGMNIMNGMKRERVETTYYTSRVVESREGRIETLEWFSFKG